MESKKNGYIGVSNVLGKGNSQNDKDLHYPFIEIRNTQDTYTELKLTLTVAESKALISEIEREIKFAQAIIKSHKKKKHHHKEPEQETEPGIEEDPDDETDPDDDSDGDSDDDDDSGEDGSFDDDDKEKEPTDDDDDWTDDGLGS